MDGTNHIVITFNQDRTVIDARRNDGGRILGPVGGQVADIFVHYSHGTVCAYTGAVSGDGTHMLLIGQNPLAGRQTCTAGPLTRAR